MDVVLDRGLKDLLIDYLNKGEEVRAALGIAVGVNPKHALLLQGFNPTIQSPVGNLGALFRNVEVSKFTGKTVAYHQVDYLWEGQNIRVMARCEIGADGKPFMAHQFPHKLVK